MPIYEYRCDRCGRVYEEWVGHGAPAPGSCPACGHEGRVRVPSRFAIPLSGAPGRAERAGPSCACARGGSCGCAP